MKKIGLKYNKKGEKMKIKVIGTENHAWNYVQIEHNWYAIDCTWDDPVIIGVGIVGNTTKYKYFLKGEKEFNESHFPSGQFTENGKMFEYPILSSTNYR